MTMPKAAVNKNDLSVPPQNDVRAARDVNWMKAVTIAQSPQHLSYREFRSRVLALN
jgi:hypothetical protein